MRQLTRAEVHARKVSELGLDPTALDMSSVEGVAGALRRAAGFLCPCTSSTLVRAVVGPLRGLVDDLDAFKMTVESTLEAMVAHGDILEHLDARADGATPQAALYAAPPSFVARDSGTVLILGVSSDKLSPLPDGLEQRIEYASHVRRLAPLPGEHLRGELKSLGLSELSYSVWLRIPTSRSAAEHLDSNRRALDASPPSRDIPGLRILDPHTSVRYYPGRWVEPRAQTGCFVARRHQAYGAALWCYVELQSGKPVRMCDLPHSGGRHRGCDEAWLLQMSIDACRGSPQCFRISELSREASVLEFFSPVPGWAQRRWTAIGEPVERSGSLLAYRIPKREVEEERRFAREALWLEEITKAPR